MTEAEASAALGGATVKTGTSSVVFGDERQCGFSQPVGVAAKNVIVKTIPDYANNASYVLPSEGPVSGIGDGAWVQIDQRGTAGTITVKVGGNAFQIVVNGYDHPIDSATMQNLGKTAITRL